MIHNYDSIVANIATYRRYEVTLPFSEKMRNFEQAMVRSVLETADLAKDAQGRVHLGFSGGLDSTTCLYLLLRSDYHVVAHTICTTETHPDVVHAKQAVAAWSGKLGCCEHMVHCTEITQEDLAQSNRLLAQEGQPVDNYFMLLKCLRSHTNSFLNCDCIDELLGGYYSHQKPNALHCFQVDLTVEENRSLALAHHLSRLVPDHLEILQKFSTHYNMGVWCPYANPNVFWAASAFSVSELIDNETRKKPMVELARKVGVPEEIILRRKYGLCSALDPLG